MATLCDLALDLWSTTPLRAGFHLTAHRARPFPVGSRERVTRYRHLSAACSVGKCPRARTARR